ncbi:MAG: mechanosensitive ion channel protein MscS, partial [Planctomycetota bacterium]
AAEEAQQTVLNALRSHAAVLNDPEPLVLVDELASSTVNLRVFFWADGEKYGVLKVRSAVLRRVKVELTAAGFTLPDEAREMIFPQGVPVQMIEAEALGDEASKEKAPAPSSRSLTDESAATAVEAEGGLDNDKKEIDRQAASSRKLDEGANLLDESS